MNSYQTEFHTTTQTFFPSLEENLDYIKNALFHSGDFETRTITFNDKKHLIVFIASLVDKKKMDEFVIRPLHENKSGEIPEVINVTQVNYTTDLTKVVRGLIEGQCAIIGEGQDHAYLGNVFAIHFRNISEPTNEYVIRGSHEGFIESLQTNIYLLRKRIENPNLYLKYITLGKATNSKLALMYMKDLADPELVKTIEERLNYIDTDAIQTPGYIEEFIEDYPLSPFPQVLNTERPDRATANLMEGRIVLLMEGSPTAIILPVTFFSFYQSPDDYNSRWIVGTFLRAIRLFSFLIAIGLPAVYIALVSFNFEVIPIELVFSVKNSLEFIPFPPLLEAFIMQLTLELLKEASVRLPSPISQTIGIVGGLVIGTAVVQANLISNVMLIVVAITGIASFVVPSNEMTTTVRILGFPLMIMAALFGFVGIVFGLMILLIHMCKIEPFGHPYFAPFAPFHMNDLKDTIFRLPRWMMNTRPMDPKPQHYQQVWPSRGWKKDEK
ncbi:spore germination protein [Pseudalkalibacillus berkeleyi]|uniref:Spore germination protein n=1 Tax=Pseudalkalibacillus berkeleyi TaxID=1069813 RepID=A0ABS9GV62_9BACL|nr:spore germination protein [Pseudalkalibacillus berkeleyi]MCF6136729.1 spore germination protein [Pseudalkalibacillus berkeleyi]